VLVSSYILREAARLGVGKSMLARMAFNIALEGLVGLIPFAGDVFDAAWKANQRNVRLLGAWLDQPRRAERASTACLLSIFLGLIAFAVVTIYLTYLLLQWLVGS
jgi:Domain of unknown function (DUF4112)